MKKRKIIDNLNVVYYFIEVMVEIQQPHILTFIRQCAEYEEEVSKGIPKINTRMWDHQLTLQDLRLHSCRIPQKRIQEENVRYGLAYCANETKAKSLRKLSDFLMKTPNPVYVAENSIQNTTTNSNRIVEVQLDDNIIIQVKLPENKTKNDLIAYICSFETQN